MAQHQQVLAIQDTTYLNYIHHPQIEGLGPSGKKSQKQSGFRLHSTLVTMAELIAVSLTCRAP